MGYHTEGTLAEQVEGLESCIADIQAVIDDESLSESETIDQIQTILDGTDEESEE